MASLHIPCAPINCNSCMLYSDRLKTMDVNLHKESIFLWSENSHIIFENFFHISIIAYRYLAMFVIITTDHWIIVTKWTYHSLPVSYPTGHFNFFCPSGGAPCSK